MLNIGKEQSDGSTGGTATGRGEPSSVLPPAEPLKSILESDAGAGRGNAALIDFQRRNARRGGTANEMRGNVHVAPSNVGVPDDDTVIENRRENDRLRAMQQDRANQLQDQRVSQIAPPLLSDDAREP